MDRSPSLCAVTKLPPHETKQVDQLLRPAQTVAVAAQGVYEANYRAFARNSVLTSQTPAPRSSHRRACPVALQ